MQTVNMKTICMNSQSFFSGKKGEKYLKMSSAESFIQQALKMITVFSDGSRHARTCFHHENTPIQIYWKFHHQKMKIFRYKILIFFIFLLKT